MRLEDFDFDLPEALIALRPTRPRSAARLLVAEGAVGIAETTVARLGDWLGPGDLLVFNDTKVIPARLTGHRARAGSPGARIDVTLMSGDGGPEWRALARPGKRLAIGDRIDFGALSAEVLDKDGAEVRLRFDKAGAEFAAALDAAGEVPLPPYIAARRAPDAADRADYQTVFAARPGAVAAPTASLHFDADLLADLTARGVQSARVTLHVGAGTFLPVKTTDIAAHRMHAEWGDVGPETVEAIRAVQAAGGRVIPAGTTALRVLETAAAQPGGLAPWRGETDIFIRPGFTFRVTDGLMTNFHLPKSTLMMLVCALMGTERMRAVYAHAIAAGFRFFSYGDASLLLPERRERR